MNRRAFTMLELTLAVMIGTLVLTGALGVFASLDRGDRALALRAKENAGLELAAGAVEQAMGTLVMETGGQTKANPAGGAKAGQSAAAGEERAPAPALGRARFLLEPDPTPGLPGMPDLAAPGAAGAESAPQRLELVVARHPAPVDARPRAKTSTPEGEGTGGPVQIDTEPLAVRGEFDLRPEAPGAGADSKRTWALWWRPLERRVDQAGAEVYLGDDARAVRLATGLKSCRWTVYYEEGWKTEHRTAAVLDLPAYVKLQVETSAGLEADWLFEVAWSIGPEFLPPDKPGDEEKAGAGAQDGGDLAVPVQPMTPTAPAASAASSTAQPQRAMPKGPARPAKPGAIRPGRPPTRPPGGAPPRGPR